MRATEPMRVRTSFCPHCCNRAPQELKLVQRFADQGYDLVDQEAIDYDASYYIAICATCKQVLVYYTFDEMGEQGFPEAELLWPEAAGLSWPSRAQKLAARAATSLRKHGVGRTLRRVREWVQIRRSLRR